MKKGVKILFFLSVCISMNFLLMSIVGRVSANPSDDQDMKAFLSSSLGKDEVAFMFLDYSGVIIRIADQTILVDPAASLSKQDLEVLNIKGVDLLLYTHAHWDHFNLSTALDLYEGSQPFVACEPNLAVILKEKIPPKKLISAASGKSFMTGKITLDAVEGRHIGPITLYRMTIEGITIFHGGDSAYVPLGDYPSRLAFLPTGSPSPTCSPEDAFRMASDLMPQIAVAIHGSSSDHTDFKEKMTQKFPETKVIIPEKHVTEKVRLR